MGSTYPALHLYCNPPHTVLFSKNLPVFPSPPVIRGESRPLRIPRSIKGSSCGQSHHLLALGEYAGILLFEKVLRFSASYYAVSTSWMRELRNILNFNNLFLLPVPIFAFQAHCINNHPLLRLATVGCGKMKWRHTKIGQLPTILQLAVFFINFNCKNNAVFLYNAASGG